MIIAALILVGISAYCMYSYVQDNRKKNLPARKK
ncbi:MULTISPECIES: small membrane protein [Enterobacteriaceae]